MTDEELERYGRDTRYMASPPASYGQPRALWGLQLEEARAEWRRRKANPSAVSDILRGKGDIGIMSTDSMSESDARLIDEAIAWISELNAIIPAGETRPTMTFIILTGPGPTPAYALLRCKEPESPIEAALGSHPTLGDAIEAMKRAAGGIAPHGWRFRLMCRGCN